MRSLVSPRLLILSSSAALRLGTKPFFSTTTALNMAQSNKPSIPEGYTVPTVWKYDAATMQPFHGSNQPTSGAQTDKDLPKGEHDIQLYGLATPNGAKVSILLEELVELKDTFEYDAYTINIMQGDQFTSGFVGVNPNSKIPAIYDQSNGARVFESGAILLYLAEKYDSAFLPTDPVAKAECMSWVFFQVGAGPYYGGGGMCFLGCYRCFVWSSKPESILFPFFSSHLWAFVLLLLSRSFPFQRTSSGELGICD